MTMRKDQEQRLDDLAERIIDQALQDADPANWTASEKPPRDMSQDERGDAQWCRKVATGTLAIANQVLVMRERLKQQDAEWRRSWGDNEQRIDDAITRAEKEADALMKRLRDPEKEASERRAGR